MKTKFGRVNEKGSSDKNRLLTNCWVTAMTVIPSMTEFLKPALQKQVSKIFNILASTLRFLFK